MGESSPRQGNRILVAEDEALISVILSGDLRDEGYVIAGPFSGGQDAIAWLQDETPDLAIIDYMLRDGPCTTLIQTLHERRVPFFILSGYPRDPDMESAFQEALWFEKPVSGDALLAAVSTLLSRAPDEIATEK